MRSKRYVLILVLMEDALAPYRIFKLRRLAVESLNPCFNGRCTRTLTKKLYLVTHNICVLILVLMEDALALVKVG